MLGEAEIVIGALLEERRVTRADVDRAGTYAAEHGCGALDALVHSGVITRRELAITHAGVCEVPFVDPAHYEISIQHCALLPRATAESLRAFPLFVIDRTATVGMVSPQDLRAVDQLRSLLRLDIEPVLCEPEALGALIERAYALGGQAGLAGDAGGGTAQAPLTSGKEPIVAAVNQILAQALERGASDIHIGPDDQQLHLRFRIDGTLHAQQAPGLAAHGGIVQRLKVMAQLDLTQSRRPQDGKFRFVHEARNVDVRASFIPTVCGENVVLRLLPGSACVQTFADLGMAPGDVASMHELLEAPSGMILVTGPTGSGKTTTLYAALKRLNGPELNIVTIEDPVEIRLPLVRQVQVNAEIGMTFAGALRSILRQDPDVVMVGEVRDEETARIALQAALTGHLVLSSIHTSDAPGAVTRLRHFGVPSFAINSAVRCAVAQRLVRRVCDACARPAQATPQMLRRFGFKDAPAHLRQGAGCARCASTGYRGRVGLYELLRLTPGLQRCIDEELAGARLREAALQGGLTPMWVDGARKAALGLTTLDEVAAAVGLDATDAEVARAQAGELRLSA